MEIYDLYSRRRAKERGNIPDVYQYEVIPEPLRVQVIHIWSDTFGDINGRHASKVKNAYHGLAQFLRREYGVFSLVANNHYPDDPDYSYDELRDFFLASQDTDRVIDVVELSCRMIDHYTRQLAYLGRQDFDEIADEALKELNHRFRQHGVGYQFSDGKMIRTDSDLLHEEVVRPTLALLRDPNFAGAQKEFLLAHEHYRHNRKAEALVECLKAFESTMKSICNGQKWQYDKSGSAKHLIDTCLKNGLVPQFAQAKFAALRTLLESAVPTPRNKMAGHGAGTSPTDVPDDLVPYVLHMTAATILFLVDANRRLP